MSEFSTRVLLVEDEVDAREILAFYLETLFDEVSIARDGQEGYNLYQEALKENKAFDLVITDIKMPNKDGLSMIDDISSLNEEQKFIIVSAHKDEEYLFRSISMNVISYFVKPLDVNKIMEILKKVKVKVLEDKTKENKSTSLLIINKNYSYNSKNNTLYFQNKMVSLSKKESLLLLALFTDISEIKTKEYLKDFVWKDGVTTDATLRTVIKRLKDKITQEDFIVSKKGLGYIIDIK